MACSLAEVREEVCIGVIRATRHGRQPSCWASINKSGIWRWWWKCSNLLNSLGWTDWGQEGSCGISWVEVLLYRFGRKRMWRGCKRSELSHVVPWCRESCWWKWKLLVRDCLNLVGTTTSVMGKRRGDCCSALEISPKRETNGKHGRRDEMCIPCFKSSSHHSIDHAVDPIIGSALSMTYSME